MTKLLLAALAIASASASETKTVTVKMLNSGSAGMMVFEPAFIQVNPGDTIEFVPTNPGHNAESITSIMPAGAAPFKGNMSQPLAVKFTKVGLYGVECLPHFALGMVALVQVGNRSPNIGQARVEAAKLPVLARKRMEPLVAAAR